MLEQTAVLIGSWDGMDGRESVVRVGGLEIERCPARAEPLRDAFRVRRPAWLLIGLGVEDGTAVGLVSTVRLISPEVRLGVFGEADDARRCQRWARRGCSFYLARSAGLDRVLFALAGATDHEVVLFDQSFYPSLTEAARETPPHLTVRERDVLEQVVAGRRNRDIAITLHVSENTVETHLRNLFSKLHVKSRAEAVEKAIRTGIG